MTSKELMDLERRVAVLEHQLAWLAKRAIVVDGAAAGGQEVVLRTVDVTTPEKE